MAKSRKYTKQGFVNGQVLEDRHLISLEDAIQEVEGRQDETEIDIGNLDDLVTTDKGSLVSAVNELARQIEENDGPTEPEPNPGADTNGSIWKPNVDAEGNISWSKSSDTTAPATQNIKGPPGDAGFSPTATVKETADGAVITITDENGTTTATVHNGTGSGDGTTAGDLTPITSSEIDDICDEEEAAVVIESDDEAVELETTEQTAPNE